MPKPKKPSKKIDPSDCGLHRRARADEKPLEGIPAIRFDPSEDEPEKLVQFLIENSPLIAAYQKADDARRRFPECTRRNAEFAEADKELKADPVAAAIHSSLVGFELCWQSKGRSERTAFMAGWELARALDLWVGGEELLRKRNLKTGKPLASRPRPGRAMKNPLRAVVTGNAWPDYLEESGPDGTPSGFVKWLKSEGLEGYSISYDRDEDSFRYQGVEVRPDTVRRWI